MGFPLSRLLPVTVTVHGVSHGQMIINNFGWRASDELALSGVSDSGTFLSAFATIWRNFILPVMYPSYSVYRYWLRTIGGAEAIPNTNPVQFKPLYGVFEDFLAGHTVLDVGAKALVGDYLPEFIAMTCTRVHMAMGRRYWRSSVRIGPHTEADQGTSPNLFNTARVDEVDNAMDAIRNGQIDDGNGATNDWTHATFSPTYYGRVLLGAGPLRPATNVVVNYMTSNVVTSQLSRKVKGSAGG